jgi:L-threonylcarbamoyladenylate synthase
MPAERLDAAALLESGDVLRRTAERVRGGAVFVYPTETIYGVGGVPTEEVRRRIVAAKGRRPGHPMILLAACREHLDELGVVFPPTASRLAGAFWPGNLTLVLPSSGGGDTVGVRVSDHPVVAALGRSVGRPLFSTSANLGGEAYDGDPDRIFEIFGERVDFMVDAGRLPFSPPSTVVGVTARGEVVVLREGVVPAGRIDELLGGGRQ